MLVEFGSKRHRVDGNGLAVCVKDDYLKESADPVGAYVEITVALVEHAEGISDRVFNIQIVDTMLASIVGNLHICRLPCLRLVRQVTLHSAQDLHPLTDPQLTILVWNDFSGYETSGASNHVGSQTQDSLNRLEPHAVIADLFGEHVSEHAAIPVQLRPRLCAWLRARRDAKSLGVVACGDPQTLDRQPDQYVGIITFAAEPGQLGDVLQRAKQATSQLDDSHKADASASAADTSSVTTWT